MDTIDITLMKEMEKGIPYEKEPYSVIGRNIGISEEEVLHRIHNLRESGVIRKVRGRISQRKLGITANALVAWQVGDDVRERKARLLSEFPGVTHCYERLPVPGKWEYTLYTVHHGYERDKVTEEIVHIAKQADIHIYVIIFSSEECKRIPCMRINTSEEIP